jgi:hypothetical protein
MLHHRVKGSCFIFSLTNLNEWLRPWLSLRRFNTTRSPSECLMGRLVDYLASFFLSQIITEVKLGCIFLILLTVNHWINTIWNIGRQSKKNIVVILWHISIYSRSLILRTMSIWPVIRCLEDKNTQQSSDFYLISPKLKSSKKLIIKPLFSMF